MEGRQSGLGELRLQRDGHSGRIVREKDGSSSGCFGPFVLKTALQPIFGQSNDGQLTVRGLEALLRLYREGKPYPTSRFFSQVGGRERRVLDSLCVTLHLANAALERDGDLLLFLNLSPALYRSKLKVLSEIDAFVRMVGRSRFATHQIICEITEDQAARSDILRLMVTALRQNGFQIAVDDYGVASSDSDRVSLIRPDIVKLDGDWSKRLMATEPGYSVLRDCVSRFHDKGIAVVIEGLESHWQIDLGWGAGADYIQGYGLARPRLAPTTFTTQPQGTSAGHN